MEKRKWRPKFLPKAWHPKSWSQQAREKADVTYRNYIVGNYTYTIWLIDTLDRAEIGGEIGAIYSLANSYRVPIIRYRAAKRLGRLIRGKSKMSCKF